MPASPALTNPFPGLRPFELDEEHLFFGREGQADELVRRLERTRLLAVVGTSGSGKSSLVRAGLLPCLYSGFLPGASSNWRVAVLRPGNAPMGNLALALHQPQVLGVELSGDDRVIRTALIESTLRRGELGLVEVVQQARLAAAENLLVVVDQFEELFRFKARAQGQGEDLLAEEEAAAFVKLLLAAVGQRQVPIFVVLTLRSDFLGDCAQFRHLPETLNDSQYLIPRLTRDQLRRAIEGPVAVGGATITPRLVNRLLNDTGDNPDQLPILQHALMRTWDYWRSRDLPEQPLDISDYEAIGGIAQALSRHADQIYGGLPDDRARQIAEVLFRCLTDRVGDDSDVRRPTELQEIAAVANATEAEVTAVIEAFRAPQRSFLVPPPPLPLTATTVVDISHESLIRNWDTLKDWVTREGRSATIYRRLAETAALHRQGEADYLRDPELTIGLTWQRERQPNPTWGQRYAPNFEEAMAFLSASCEVRTSEAAEREASRRREINRLRGFIALLGGLTLLAGGTSMAAWLQGQEAWEQKQKALVQKQIAEEQRQEALKQTTIAQQKSQEAEAQKIRALQERDRAQTAERAAEAEKQKAVAARQAEAEQKQIAEQQRQQALEQTAIAQQNERLARENQAEATKQTNVANQARETAQRQTLMAEIQAGAFETENLMASGLNFKAWLAALNLSQRIRPQGPLAWDSRSKVNIQRYRPLTVDGATRLQAVSVLREVVYGPSWREKNTLRSNRAVAGLSFSPDDQWLVSTGEGGTIQRWDRSGKLLSPLSGHTAMSNKVSVSSDGRLIASSSDDGTIRVWDSRTGAERAVLQGHQGWVEGVSFSPDGKTLVSSGQDGTVRLWNLAAEQRGQESPLLQESGTLVPGPLLRDPEGADSPWSRDTYVQEHRFSVKAGEKVLIRLDSQDFDPYLRLLDPEGQVIAENDDRFGQNSGIGITLDRTGTYRIQVTSYVQEATGSYRLVVRSAIPEQVIKGHTSVVQGVTFSPDGQSIASASDDNTARIWDLRGNLQQVLQGHSARVNTVKFSPDGKTLGTSSRDGTARLWNLAALDRQGVVLLNTEGQLAPGPLLKDPEGTTNPWNKDTYVQEHRFSVKAGEKVLIRLDSQDFDPVLRLLDPEGQVIADNDNRFGRSSGIGRTIYQTGTYRIQVTSAPEKATGSYRLSVTTAEPETVLWGHGKALRSLDFSPGGDQVVTASEDATLKLWSMQGRLLQTLAGHAGMVNVVSFIPGGAIASGSGDRTIKVWQPSGEGLSRLEAHDSQVSAITFTPDGQTLATAGSDGTIKLWDARTRQELQSLRGHSGPVWDVSFAPNGQTLATAGSDDRIKLWDTKTGKVLKTLEGHEADVNSVRFAPNGQALASASEDGTVKLWNPRTGQLLHTLIGHQGPVWAVTFSPDSQTLASAGQDRRVKLWNVITGKAVKTLEGHLSEVSAVVFSPDGEILATGGLNDGVVKLWNRETGKELKTLAGHTDGILELSFSPDGQTLASASLDRTVKLWNVTTGKELQTLEGHQGPVRSVTFAPDGQTLASGDREDGTVIFWNLNLEDLMGRSCSWLADYMANPATPLEEKALCKGYLPVSRPLSSWAPWHWLGQVRGFWQGLWVPPGGNLSPVGELRPSRADAEQG